MPPVPPMTNGVQIAFQKFYEDYRNVYRPSNEQDKAARSIMLCKTGQLGANACLCGECGHIEFHNNSCRDRNCPSCQAILREIWIDNRSSEIIDASYFHVVFTVPFELNGLIYANQSALYSLMHRVVSQTLLQLSADRKFLGATPGIIQVLHTWGQELNFHPHIHCIITGAGVTSAMRFVKGRDNFFIPVRVLSKVFRGKFIHELKNLFASDRLSFPGKLSHLNSPEEQALFIKKLYSKEWVPHVKETFKQFGNAIEYLGRYTHRIAISNSRIISVSDHGVSFSAKDYRDGSTRAITLPGIVFIRLFLLHVLPKGFQKIRYSGFLNNRFKSRNLLIICRCTGKYLSMRRFGGMSKADIIQAVWGVNIRICPICNCDSLKPLGAGHMRN
jgi:hypothetical protein